MHVFSQTITNEVHISVDPCMSLCVCLIRNKLKLVVYIVGGPLVVVAGMLIINALSSGVLLRNLIDDVTLFMFLYDTIIAEVVASGIFTWAMPHYN